MVEAVDASQITIPETDLDDGDYDPFKVFDEGQGFGGDNPYPEFIQKRRQAPIEELDIRALMGLDVGDPLPDHVGEMPPTYTAYSHAAVTEVLQDGVRFSSAGYSDVMGSVFGHSILEMDDPEHRRMRALVAQAFRPKVLKRWEEDLVQPVIDELIDQFEAQGHVDLTQAYTFTFPVKIISGLLGVPLEHWEWYRRRAVETISIVQNWDRAHTAARALQEYFSQIIQLRRKDPQGDLISELVQAEVDGHKLSDEEILPFLMLLSPAGAETTYRSTGNLLYGLFTHPDQYKAVREDRSLLKQAVEEAIRWEAPLLFIQRKVTEDTTIQGVPVPAGATIGVSLGSANRDETVFGDTAEEFDIHRDTSKHIAFATGPHMCLGMHLARMEMTMAVNRLLDRLPNLRLDPAQADEVKIEGIVFRSPNALPVIWDL